MSVLNSIIEGVREDLAARRLPMGQLQEALETAPAVRDCLPHLMSSEQRRFGGTLADLDAVRKAIDLPILRKDFMVDEYQFYEARAHGADVVLLIVAALSKNQLEDYFHLSTELGMRSLIEVHTNDELERALEISPQIIGVNSRNLKTLEVDARAFAELIPQIPSTIARVAESGISTREEVEFAQECGATAILVGEALVRSGSPSVAINQLLGRL